MENLARNYKIDVQKLESISKFVNSPSVDSGSVVKTVDEDGNESRSMLVCGYMCYLETGSLFTGLFGLNRTFGSDEYSIEHLIS